MTLLEEVFKSRRYAFSRTNGVGASGNLSASGSGKVITITGFPHGMAVGNEIRISGGSGTDEVVAITAVSGVGGASTGTVTVTTANVHTGSWVVGSSTGGTQEAMWATGGGGRVRMPSGDIHLYGHVKAPVNYPISLRGNGEGVTVLKTHGLTGDWIWFPGGSGYVDVGDFSIVDAASTTHTSGSMVRADKKVYGAIDHIEVENGYWGITTVGCANVQAQNCVVGAQNFCFYVTTLGVAYPTIQQSTGHLANCYGSLTGLAGSVYQVEGPASGLVLANNVGICNTKNANNRVLQIIYSTALGGQEISVLGGVYDAGGSGILLFGDSGTYPSFWYVFDGVECSGSEYGFYADAKMANIHWTGGLIKAAGGATQQSLFLRSVKNARFCDVPMECLGASGITVEDVTDVLLDGVILGKNGTTPTNALAFNGAATRFVAQNCDFGACSTKVANPNLAASPLKFNNNIGLDDVIPTIASAATITQPVNPTASISGTTTITTITPILVAGSRLRLVKTDAGSVTVGGGGNIPGSHTLAQYGGIDLVWNGTSWL